MISFLLVSSLALGAGYHTVRADVIYGTSGDDQLEGGFGLGLYSDELRWWITFGDPDQRGHRVREWWFEGGVFGPQLGIEPEVFRDEDEEPVEMPSFLFPFNWWRLGAEADTRRRFDFDTTICLPPGKRTFFAPLVL